MRLLFLCLVLILGASSQVYAALTDIETAIMNKDYAQARELSSKIIKNDKNSSVRTEAQYYYGLAQLRLGQYGIHGLPTVCTIPLADSHHGTAGRAYGCSFFGGSGRWCQLRYIWN